ncbi:hypothetical protein GCM10010112_64130 [Actinoplanes lobatus]|uniref:DUF2202 domain-containing protein n=1 Tax=Actinoplanes lobatus TaxID=113568 RepID=A0A7W7HN47_9ACTN|nr:DUF2202 domain-containing protein [Actinoplanes lobatus]MBB4753594.1 hypothetical protein [Actinoplanes lobatus]GGN84639.1 hypothetical protein GCM10010112_64130 [Actinoplanes lobatus]GIE38131.1 hypothetical protein Alo02nite_10290 [Actinoplanes lobatus]
MRSIIRRTATVVAAGALGLGGLAVAVPALAGNGPFGGPAASSTIFPGGDGPGYGMGNGYGGTHCMGAGLIAEQGALTGAQKATLASIAQREKLAHDLYAAFADRHDAAVFAHIARAETHHLTAVRTLLQRYGVADPTAQRPAGSFTDSAAQATYDRLLKQGDGSLSAALAAGAQIEHDDIAALSAALDGLDAADVEQVYSWLLAASQRHLTAFTS